MSFSVAEISSVPDYQTKNSNFKIICDFIGTESPVAVKWFYKAPHEAMSMLLGNGEESFDITVNSKQTILTKRYPTLDDAGEYSCLFEMEMKPEITSSARIHVAGPSK